MKYYIVDVFAEKKYNGNQLAVVETDENLKTEEMQNIAKEFNFSETTFIIKQNTLNEFNVRIFTPENELPFAGHPTLGTAYIINKKILEKEQEEIILDLKVGKISVKVDNLTNLYWMKQRQPEFLQNFDKKTIADILNIEEEEIDERYPIEEISTGIPFIITALKSLEVVKKCRVNKELLFKTLKNSSEKAILVYSNETYNDKNDLNCRVFVDCYGVPEDPATGSANGCLLAYLLKNKYFKKDEINIKVEQGIEINRESLLYLNGKKEKEEYIIKVGGRVVEFSEGIIK